MTQGTLTFEPKKLSRQQGFVLEALKAGPKTNVELLDICIRFSARKFELIRLGYDIQIVSRGKHGIVTYALTMGER